MSQREDIARRVEDAVRAELARREAGALGETRPAAAETSEVAEPYPKGPAPPTPPKADVDPRRIPVGVSGRHLHISAADLERLLGPGAALSELRLLRQPGQFAAAEVLRLVGRKEVLTLRILGPERERTTLELAVSDLARLGNDYELRPGGAVVFKEAPLLLGPAGELRLSDEVTVADRHLHCAPAEAAALGLSDGQRISLVADGWRGARFDQVRVRVDENYRLELHLDTDEGNAANLRTGNTVRLAAVAPPPLGDTVTAERKPRSVDVGLISSGGREPRVLGGSAGVKPLGLVTENDVRAAARTGLGELPVTPRAIVTPAARDALRDLGLRLVTRR